MARIPLLWQWLVKETFDRSCGEAGRPRLRHVLGVESGESCSDDRCVSGCRLAGALGNLGLTIKDRRVCFFHCGGDTTTGAEIDHDAELDEEAFERIVETAFQRERELSGEHTADEKRRWKGQSKLVFDRYAGAKVLTHKAFLQAIAARGLSLPHEGNIFVEGEEINCHQFSLIIQYLVLHQELRRSFEGLPKEEPKEEPGSNPPAMPVWLADPGAISSFPRVFRFFSGQARTMPFASYQACVACCMLAPGQSSSWDELLHDYIDPTEPTGRTESTGQETSVTNSQSYEGQQTAQDIPAHVEEEEEEEEEAQHRSSGAKARGSGHLMALARAQQEVAEMMREADGIHQLNPRLAPVRQRLIVHTVAPGMTHLPPNEWGPAISEHLETLSATELVALIPCLLSLRAAMCGRGARHLQLNPARSQVENQLDRLGWCTALAQGPTPVIERARLQDPTSGLLSAAGLKLCDMDLDTLTQYGVLGRDVRLTDVEDTMHVVAGYVEARQNLQYWIAESLDLNAVASSLAASSLAEEKKGRIRGSEWHLCLQHLDSMQGVESWLSDVARKAAPMLWKNVKTINDDLLVAQAEESLESGKEPMLKVGGDKFSIMPTARFGNIDTFYGGLDKQIGLPQPDVFEQMRKEHAFTYPFTTTNYGLLLLLLLLLCLSLL